MIGFISYLLQVDQKTWKAFRARLNKDGMKVGEGLIAIIKWYTKHGIDDTKPKEKP